MCSIYIIYIQCMYNIYIYIYIHTCVYTYIHVLYIIYAYIHLYLYIIFIHIFLHPELIEVLYFSIFVSDHFKVLKAVELP